MIDNEEFRRLLEENIPYLQQRILNLENFVPRADFEKIQQQLPNFDDLKNDYEKLKTDFDALNNENKNLKSESDNTEDSRLKFADEVQNLTTENSSLQRENNDLKEELDALTMKNQSLTKQFKSSENARMKFFDQIQNLEVEKMALQREKKSLQDEISAANSEIENLKSERDKLAAAVQNLETEKNKIERENNFLQDRIAAASEKLDLFEETATALQYYKNSFAEIDNAYQKYLSLNEKIRYNLAGIFGEGTNIQGFLFGAANEKHLNEFWEYLRYSINDGRLSEGEKNTLSAIFDFCFNALNKSSRDKIFVRLNTEIGSNFDNRIMTRTSDSKQLGKVKKVLLEGYANRVGNVVQPSLVLIDD